MCFLVDTIHHFGDSPLVIWYDWDRYRLSSRDWWRGDELRKDEDPCLRKFEINLRLWLESVVVNNKRSKPGVVQKKDAAKTVARSSPQIAMQTDN